jgi:Fic family protein
LNVVGSGEGIRVARFLAARWEPEFDAPSARDRRGGTYRTYLPDPLLTRPLVVDAVLTRLAARVEAAVRDLSSGTGARSLEGLARFLLRSEAIASSRIEGLQVSAQQVALAELAQTEQTHLHGFTANARLVANNITALRRATRQLADAPAVTVDGIADLHAALLPDHKPAGLRDVQNWIGGSDWHPLDADFVPPPAECVGELMDDLAAYLSGAVHAPLIQAALAHAQFETIHPFTDGNGRVGRALIHTVLVRRGLTTVAILPVSLVLLTRSQAYVAGLGAYRYDGLPSSPAAQDGVGTWLATFLDAVEVATDQARAFATDLAELHAEWTARHMAFRQSRGLRKRPRADAAVARLLNLLPEAPLLTARTAERLLAVSFPAARAALDELAAVRILTPKQVERGTTGYLAREVFDLLTGAERRLASTRWDTRRALPSRPVPARPSARSGATTG